MGNLKQKFLSFLTLFFFLPWFYFFFGLQLQLYNNFSLIYFRKLNLPVTNWVSHYQKRSVMISQNCLFLKKTMKFGKIIYRSNIRVTTYKWIYRSNFKNWNLNVLKKSMNILHMCNSKIDSKKLLGCPWNCCCFFIELWTSISIK